MHTPSPKTFNAETTPCQSSLPAYSLTSVNPSGFGIQEGLITVLVRRHKCLPLGFVAHATNPDRSPTVPAALDSRTISLRGNRPESLPQLWVTSNDLCADVSINLVSFPTRDPVRSSTQKSSPDSF